MDDGSKDGTGNRMDTLADGIKIRIVHHPTNLGRGHALKTIFKAAAGDIIITLDSDLSYGPDHIVLLLDKMEETGADIVSASPYRPGGVVENVPWFRHFVSWLGNKLLCFAMSGSATVVTCIVRAYRTEVIRNLDLYADGKELHPEILMKAQILGYRLTEIPATLRWSDHKVTAARAAPKRKSKFKFSETAITHLFQMFYARPILVFVIPGLILCAYGLFMIGLLAYRVEEFFQVNVQNMPLGESLALAIRQMIEYYLSSFILCGMSLFFGIQFMMLGFLSLQNKHNFQELYRLIAARTEKKD